MEHLGVVCMIVILFGFSRGADAIWDSTTELSQFNQTDTLWYTTTGMTQPEGTVTTWGTTEMSRLEGGCGGTLTNVSGTILSPNYPNPYSSSTDCEWKIKVSAGNVILFRIVDLELEADDQCRFDYVEIFQGFDKRGRKFGKYCDRNHPTYVQTTSNAANIRFHSDSTLSGRGFYINYQTVCHNKFHGFRGVIESPDFPNNYPHRLNCTWTIEAPLGNNLSLTFSDFNLETGRGGSCLYDYLDVMEGKDDQPSKRIGKFCDSRVLPLRIDSTERQLFLEFLSDSSVSSKGFRLEWVVNGCGGTLTQPEGIITSPEHLMSHSQNIDCEWTIKVKYSQSIEITLEDVHLGTPPKCSFSKLIVYNGADWTAPKLIETCHTDRSITLTSTSNKLLVKLHVDHSDHHPRFKASYKSVDIQCGGRFIAPTGFIHSINHPPNYPPTQDCNWLIQVPINYVVNLTFTDFDIQYSENCSQDYVRIFDGSSPDAPVLGSYCDNALPPSHISSTNELLVVRKSGSTLPTKGFKATYELACGLRIVTDDQGILSIGSAVGLYKEITNCSWTIVAQDPDDHVTFTLTEMQVLSMHLQHDDCQSSSLEIYEGEGTNGRLLGTWCNTTVPPPVQSQGNALTIQTTSLNGTLYNTKFSGFYSVHNPACGGNFTSEYGTIATPRFPSSYPKNIECIWHLQASPGDRVRLSFRDLDIIKSKNCNLDFVEVREENSNGKLIGVYCGSNINAINSPKSLWIKFKSNAEKRGKGFVADYSLLHGGHFSGPSGEIASPLYPRPCIQRGEYFWRIFVDSTSSVQITFEDFHIEQSEDECTSFITIYDGYDVNAPELLTKCGVTLPEAVRSTSNVVYIKFFNYRFRKGNWFLLNWLQVPREYDRNHF